MTQLQEQLEAQKVGFFGDRASCMEALKYAQSLFPSQQADVTTAILVYHNTLIEELKQELSV